VYIILCLSRVQIAVFQPICCHEIFDGIYYRINYRIFSCLYFKLISSNMPLSHNKSDTSIWRIQSTSFWLKRYLCKLICYYHFLPDGRQAGFCWLSSKGNLIMLSDCIEKRICAYCFSTWCIIKRMSVISLMTIYKNTLLHRAALRLPWKKFDRRFTYFHKTCVFKNTMCFKKDIDI
jgi:hypothetical protein